jgi:hypothetical protein
MSRAPGKTVLAINPGGPGAGPRGLPIFRKQKESDQSRCSAMCASTTHDQGDRFPFDLPS